MKNGETGEWFHGKMLKAMREITVSVFFGGVE